MSCIMWWPLSRQPQLLVLFRQLSMGYRLARELVTVSSDAPKHSVHCAVVAGTYKCVFIAMSYTSVALPYLVR